MSNTHFFGSGFFSGEFFFSGAAVTFGNLGFFDIGGEMAGVEEFVAKQERLRSDIQRAFGMEPAAPLLQAYRAPDKLEFNIPWEAYEQVRAEVTAFIAGIEQRRRDEDEDDTETILWLM